MVNIAFAQNMYTFNQQCQGYTSHYLSLGSKCHQCPNMLRTDINYPEDKRHLRQTLRQLRNTWKRTLDNRT